MIESPWSNKTIIPDVSKRLIISYLKPGEKPSGIVYLASVSEKIDSVGKKVVPPLLWGIILYKSCKFIVTSIY